MAKVTGIGGVFWRASDKAGALGWFRDRLGMDTQDFGTVLPPEPNGRFAHVLGPDGVKIALWEPADPDPYDP